MDRLPAHRLPIGIIVDVDGTLCDVSGIRHHVEPGHEGYKGTKDFHRFHMESLDCPPNGRVVELTASLAQNGYSIIVVTSRPRRWSFLTTLWLAENNVTYESVHFRDDRDGRADTLVKADMLHMIKRNYNIAMAIDDNDEIIKMWITNGIPVIKVEENGRFLAWQIPERVNVSQKLVTLVREVQ